MANTPQESREMWRETLARHFLLHHLGASELDELLAFARARRSPAREVLFQKGDPGDSLIAVLSGRIKISTISEDGKEIVLNILGPGELFGEIALLDGRERSADATVMEASELLYIDGGDFKRFLENRPELTTRLLIVLCSRIRWINDLYEDTVFFNLPTRLAKHLLRLSEQFGVKEGGGIKLNLRLSQQDLGNLMGTTRESINKLMRNWHDEGLVDMDRGTIIIRQPDALEQLSHTS